MIPDEPGTKWGPIIRAFALIALALELVAGVGTLANGSPVLVWPFLIVCAVAVIWIWRRSRPR